MSNLKNKIKNTYLYSRGQFGAVKSSIQNKLRNIVGERLTSQYLKYHDIVKGITLLGIPIGLALVFLFKLFMCFVLGICLI